MQKNKSLTEEIIDVNQREIEFLKSGVSQRSTGAEYLDNLHPYASDLDLFGSSSVFQFIERCSTIHGKNKLAVRLKQPLQKNEIYDNQQAVEELTKKIELRQKILGYSTSIDDAKFNTNALKEWKDITPKISNSNLLKILSFILPILSLIAFIYLCYHIPYYIALLVYIFIVAIQRKFAAHIDKILDTTSKSLKYISKYADVIREIESASFSAQKLQNIQHTFVEETVVSKKLAKLDWYIDQLELKNINLFGAIFNALTMWDIHFVRAIENWKRKNADKIDQWLDALSEFEFLSSLSNMSYNNPDWRFPVIEGDIIHTLDIGHPLLPRDKRITNSIDLPSHKHIKLITGSNMGGKSTFQRTIGINMVLAYCGSRVCAKAMKLPILKLLSSMRTQDDLSKNVSGFYSELLRLKMVLDNVIAHDDNFFLIDEILKGTNSNDRHRGSRALIQQLLRYNGAGLISTHDLALAKMEEELDGNLENISFEVDVIDDQLSFDYKLKKGVSKSFNATNLMRNIGIDI